MATNNNNKHVFTEKLNLWNGFQHKYGYMNLRRSEWHLSKITYSLASMCIHCWSSLQIIFIWSTNYTDVMRWFSIKLRDRVLFSTSELRINIDNGHVHRTKRHVHRTSISGHAQTLPPNRLVHRAVGHPGMLSEHHHLSMCMCIEPHRTNIMQSKYTFPSDLMKSSSWLDESLSLKSTECLFREPTYI